MSTPTTPQFGGNDGGSGSQSASPVKLAMLLGAIRRARGGGGGATATSGPEGRGGDRHGNTTLTPTAAATGTATRLGGGGRTPTITTPGAAGTSITTPRGHTTVQSASLSSAAAARSLRNRSPTTGPYTTSNEGRTPTSASASALTSPLLPTASAAASPSIAASFAALGTRGGSASAASAAGVIVSSSSPSTSSTPLHHRPQHQQHRYHVGIQRLSPRQLEQRRQEGNRRATTAGGADNHQSNHIHQHREGGEGEVDEGEGEGQYHHEHDEEGQDEQQQQHQQQQLSVISEDDAERIYTLLQEKDACINDLLLELEARAAHTEAQDARVAALQTELAASERLREVILHHMGGASGTEGGAGAGAATGSSGAATATAAGGSSAAAPSAAVQQGGQQKGKVASTSAAHHSNANTASTEEHLEQLVRQHKTIESGLRREALALRERLAKQSDVHDAVTKRLLHHEEDRLEQRQQIEELLSMQKKTEKQLKKARLETTTALQQRDILEKELRGLCDELRALTDSAASSTEKHQHVIEALAAKLASAEGELKQKTALSAAEESAKTQLAETVSSLEGRLREEEVKVINLTADIRARERHGARAFEDYQNNQQLVATMEARIAELEEKLLVLTTDLHEEREKRRSSEEERLLMESNLKSHLRRIEQLEDVLEEKTQREGEYVEDITAIRQERDEFACDVTAIQAAHTSICAEKEELLEELKQQKETVALLRDEISHSFSAKDSENSALDHRIALLETALKEEKGRFLHTKELLEKANHALKKAEQQHEAEKEEWRRLQIQDQLAQSSVTTRQVSLLKSSHRETDALRREVESLGSTVGALKQSVESLEAEKLSLSSSLSTMNGKWAAEKAHVGRLAKQIATSEVYIAQLEAAAQHHDALRLTLEAEAEVKKNALEKCKKQQRLADDRIASLQKYVAEHKNDLTTFDAVVKQKTALELKIKQSEALLATRQDTYRRAWAAEEKNRNAKAVAVLHKLLRGPLPELLFPVAAATVNGGAIGDIDPIGKEVVDDDEGQGDGASDDTRKALGSLIAALEQMVLRAAQQQQQKKRNAALSAGSGTRAGSRREEEDREDDDVDDALTTNVATSTTTAAPVLQSDLRSQLKTLRGDLQRVTSERDCLQKRLQQQQQQLNGSGGDHSCYGDDPMKNSNASEDILFSKLQKASATLAASVVDHMRYVQLKGKHMRQYYKKKSTHHMIQHNNNHHHQHAQQGSIIGSNSIEKNTAATTVSSPNQHIDPNYHNDYPQGHHYYHDRYVSDVALLRSAALTLIRREEDLLDLAEHQKEVLRRVLAARRDKQTQQQHHQQHQQQRSEGAAFSSPSSWEAVAREAVSVAASLREALLTALILLPETFDAASTTHTTTTATVAPSAEDDSVAVQRMTEIIAKHQQSSNNTNNLRQRDQQNTVGSTDTNNRSRSRSRSRSPTTAASRCSSTTTQHTNTTNTTTASAATADASAASCGSLSSVSTSSSAAMLTALLQGLFGGEGEHQKQQNHQQQNLQQQQLPPSHPQSSHQRDHQQFKGASLAPVDVLLERFLKKQAPQQPPMMPRQMPNPLSPSTSPPLPAVTINTTSRSGSGIGSGAISGGSRHRSAVFQRHLHEISQSLLNQSTTSSSTTHPQLQHPQQCQQQSRQEEEEDRNDIENRSTANQINGDGFGQLLQQGGLLLPNQHQQHQRQPAKTTKPMPTTPPQKQKRKGAGVVDSPEAKRNTNEESPPSAAPAAVPLWSPTPRHQHQQQRPAQSHYQHHNDHEGRLDRLAADIDALRRRSASVIERFDLLQTASRSSAATASPSQYMYRTATAPAAATRGHNNDKDDSHRFHPSAVSNPNASNHNGDGDEDMAVIGDALRHTRRVLKALRQRDRALLLPAAASLVEEGASTGDGGDAHRLFALLAHPIDPLYSALHHHSYPQHHHHRSGADKARWCGVAPSVQEENGVNRNGTGRGDESLDLAARVRARLRRRQDHQHQKKQKRTAGGGGVLPVCTQRRVISTTTTRRKRRESSLSDNGSSGVDRSDDEDDEVEDEEELEVQYFTPVASAATRRRRKDAGAANKDDEDDDKREDEYTTNTTTTTETESDENDENEEHDPEEMSPCREQHGGQTPTGRAAKRQLRRQHVESARLAALHQHVAFLILKVMVAAIAPTAPQPSSHASQQLDKDHPPPLPTRRVVVAATDRRDCVRDLLPQSSRLAYLLLGAEKKLQQHQHQHSHHQRRRVARALTPTMLCKKDARPHHHHPLAEHPLGGRVSRLTLGELLTRCVDVYITTKEKTD